MHPSSEPGLLRWQQKTEWPLTVVAILFLVAYSWEVIGDLSGCNRRVAEWMINVIWALFALDYVARFVLANQKKRFFTHHLLDLVVVVLPLLRPLRLLRLVALVGVLQRTTGVALRGRIAIYTGGAAALTVYVGALAALDAERGEPDSVIKTFSEALWWAFVTITTVGYGDYSPATATGRAVAVFLMIGGIAVIGVVTATLASWIVGTVAEDNEEQAASRQQVKELHEEVRLLRGELANLTSQSGTWPPVEN